MAERMKDDQDLKLDAMFRSEPVPDDGFSARVVSRVRRRVWVRRLSLPIGITIGAAIGMKPLLQTSAVALDLLNSVFGASQALDKLPLGSMPPLSTVMLGATLVMAIMIGGKLLEE